MSRDLTLGTAHLVYNAIGRVEDVRRLHERLHLDAQPVTVTGVGGLGKTTLAQLYWQYHRKEYDCAAWLSTAALYTNERRPDNAEYFLRAFLDNQQLIDSLQLTFDPRADDVSRFRVVAKALADLGPGPHLLVIDNSPEAAAVYLHLLSGLPEWKILFTSREPIQNTRTFELEALPPDQAVALFERVYEAPADTPELRTVLQDIDYHTLTIELLAAYARDKGLDPPALLALVRKGLMQLDDYDLTVPRYHQQRDLAAHLRDLFLLDLSPEESEILRWCSILPTANLTLEAGLASEDFLCDLFGQRDQEKVFKKRLRRLASLHWLVKKDKIDDYRCHPVVAETTRAQLLPDAVNCAGVVEKVIQFLTPDEETNEPQIARSKFGPLGVAVVKGLWKESGDWVEEDLVVAEVAVWLDNLFDCRGELDKSLDYSQKALAIRKKVLPPAHPYLATSYNNLAETYRGLGEFQKSLEYHQNALAIWEKVLPPEHSDLATPFNNLGETYRALGEFQKSLEYHQKALAIREKVSLPEHPSLARSYNNLAATYYALNEYQNCLEFLQKALIIREKVLPPEHPDLAQSYNNLASSYGALGEYQKNLEYHQKALAIREKILPPEHPDLAQSYNNLASTYRTLTEHPKSLEYHQKALAILEKVLPAEHPDLALSYHNIAWTYRDLDDLEQAVQLMRRAASIWKKSLPLTHPRVALIQNSLAQLEAELAAKNP